MADPQSTPVPMKYIQFKNHVNPNVGQWAFTCALHHSGCGYSGELIHFLIFRQGTETVFSTKVMYTQLIHMGRVYGLPQEALHDYSRKSHTPILYKDISDVLT